MVPFVKIFRLAFFVLAFAAFAARASAGEALIAVAANFAAPMEALEAAFEKSSGHALTVSAGSTGKLYAQIAGGAPFDILLAADTERPERLEAEGRAVSGSRFTYAVGRLALWSADTGFIGEDGAAVLRDGKFRRLAIANPDLAPYGAAAMETLEELGLAETLRSKIVMGENIGQAYAMAASGNAELGFVALSQIAADKSGSRWVPPAALYKPIRQDAVLLARAAKNEAALAFLAYLKSEEAHAVLARSGYGTD
ncbi:MAG: molybdate ABC transporter substrate-binding protein [Amphiplicatus sp.]